MSINFLRTQVSRLLKICLVTGLLSTSAGAQQASIGDLLKVAIKGNGQQQYHAIDDLGERREDAELVVPQLVKLFKSTDLQVVWRSARAVGDYGELARSAVPGLIKLLYNKNSTVQFHAAIALGRIGDKAEATVDALVERVTDEDGHVARAAVAALRNLKPDPAVVVSALASALKSNDHAVIMHAVEAVIETGEGAVPLLNQALKQPATAYIACVAIHEIGPDAAGTVPGLTALLGDTAHSKVLIEALLALASIGPAAKSAAPKIAPLLELKEDTTVPVAAAYALGSIGAKGQESALRAALTMKEPFLQMVAAWSLAKLNPDNQADMKEAINHLTQGLASDDPMVRTTAAHTLPTLDAPAEAVAPKLVALANDPDPHVSANVVKALVSLGDRAIPYACRGLQNSERRKLAVRVLKKMGPNAKAAVGCLVQALQVDDPGFQSDVQFTLAAIGPDAAPATAALVESLSSKDDRVRHSALYALRKIGPGASAARQRLLAELQEEDFDALAAAWALAQIAPDDKAVAIQLLPALIRGLNSSDHHVRADSIEALVTCKAAGEKAVPILTAIAQKDDDPAMRAAAEEALEHIAGKQ